MKPFAHPLTAKPTSPIALCTVLLGLSHMTTFGQNLVLTMVPSNYNGYNVDCFGNKTGSIDLTVTGGTPPYTYAWTSGASTQDVSGLRAGYYEVRVRDSGTLSAAKDITLTEPDGIRIESSVYEYPNGYNVSCHSCYNGSIQVVPSGGVSPYTYLWSDGGTAQNRSALGADVLDVEMTDANGCVQRVERMSLREPDRSDWTMTGNAGTDPSTQFIGSTDNKDVVFKSNGTERLRLLANGTIKLAGFGTNGPSLLRAGGGGELTEYPELPIDDRRYPYWTTAGNTVGEDQTPEWLGTINNKDLKIRTNSLARAIFTKEGRFMLGGWSTTTANFIVDEAGQVGLGVNTGLAAPLTIKRNQGDYIQFRRTATDPGYWAIHNGDGNQTHLAFHYFVPGGQSLMNRLVLWNDGKVSIGDVSTATAYNYGLYVADGILTERVKVAIRTEPDWSDHVFKPGYRLLPLTALAEYISRNGHLPGVPSAACMVEEGLDVAKTDAMLMEKVEELTLHLIHMERRLGELEKENIALKQSVIRIHH